MGNNYNGKSSNKSWQTNKSFNNNRNQKSSNNDIRNNINYSYAPYNFIPLSNRVIERYKNISELPRHDEFTSGTLSGEISYTIENVTDLIISDGSGNSKEGIPNKFFKDVNGNYAIPGSTIRGKLRSNINTLGFSQIAEDIADERFLYRRFATTATNIKSEYGDRLGLESKKVGNKSISILTKVKAGYIKKLGDEEYVIVKSKEIKDKSYFRIAEDDLAAKYNGLKGINFMHDKSKTKYYEQYTREISYEINEDKKQIKSIGEKNKYRNNGFILGSGTAPKKKTHYIINEMDLDSTLIRLSADDIRVYNKYYVKDKKSNINKNGFYSLPEKINEAKPVFYTEYNNKIYFGFTPYLRLFYDNSIHNGVPAIHKGNIIDYKKAIFGFTNGDEAYKGRVSIEDAVIVGEARTKEYTMVLGEPKATCVQLYLQSGGDRNSLQSYNNEFSIRGIKYYWLKDNVEPQAKGNVNTIEEAIEKGAAFKGKIKFNNLNEDELGLLLWALYIHPDAQQNIGKGKPYGFGNIKVKDISLSVKDISKKYTDIFSLCNDNVNFKDYIEKYKEYARKKLDINGNIENDIAIETFIEVSKNKNRVEYVDYMSLERIDPKAKRGKTNEFEQYYPLSKPLEVIGLNKKVRVEPKNKKEYSNTKRFEKNSVYTGVSDTRKKSKTVYSSGDDDNSIEAMLRAKGILK